MTSIAVRSYPCPSSIRWIAMRPTCRLNLASFSTWSRDARLSVRGGRTGLSKIECQIEEPGILRGREPPTSATKFNQIQQNLLRLASGVFPGDHPMTRTYYTFGSANHHLLYIRAVQLISCHTPQPPAGAHPPQILVRDADQPKYFSVLPFWEPES